MLDYYGAGKEGDSKQIASVSKAQIFISVTFTKRKWTNCS